MTCKKCIPREHQHYPEAGTGVPSRVTLCTLRLVFTDNSLIIRGNTSLRKKGTKLAPTSIMAHLQKNILIIDEYRFSRICSAILETVGYGTDMISQAQELPSKLNSDAVGLIVTSYPYGAFFFDEIKKRKIPTIILSDNVDGKLIDVLRNFDNSFCMIKPLDYDKFKTLVKQVISGDITAQGGYSLV